MIAILKATQKIFLFVSIFALLSTISFQSTAQMGYGKISEIESIQKRKLIVVIEEPREKVLKKISKKPKLGSVDDYKKDLSDYNENFKAVIEAFWPYNKTGIEYMTLDAVKSLHKKKSTEYAVLRCASTLPSSSSAGYVYYDGLWWAKDIKEDFDDRNDGIFSSMIINVIEDFGGKPVWAVSLFDVFPTKASLVFGIKSIENYFDRRISTKKGGKGKGDLIDQAMENMEKRAPSLRTRTLLIREEWLDPELTPRNFSKYYPYPYKIVDKAFMDQVIMDKDPQYAYGVELPIVSSGSRSNTMVYVQFVLDPVDDEPICLVKPSTGSLMLAGYTGKAGTRNFTIKTLNKIVDQIKGKK